MVKRKVAVLMAVLVGFSYAASIEAATTKASNVLYLDAQGKVIGESLLNCDNTRAKAGVQSSAYTVTAYEGCGTPIYYCDANGCQVLPGDTSITVTTSAATNMTISEACLKYWQADCPSIEATRWIGWDYGIPYP